MANIKKSILIRIFFSFGCVVVFSGLVVWYILNIQMVDGAKWRALSDSLTLKYKVIQAVRGNIYSDDGTLLATSVPRYEIRMDLTLLSNDSFKKYIPLLAEKFALKFNDKSKTEYLINFNQGRVSKSRYFLLKRKLSYLDIKEIKTWPLFKKGRYKSGLIIEEENYRVKPYKNLLERTIGYTGTGIGKEKVGIEGAFNSQLKGKTGQRLVQKIAGGYRPVNDNNEVEPIDGKDIYTTINVDIQDIVNNALSNCLIKHQAHHGCIVVMEVKTGEIKAIANLTQTGEGHYIESFNYAIGESFEPGSTFKLVSALALLDMDKIKLEDSVLINYGKLAMSNRIMEDAEITPFKKQTFSYAFEHSSNVGISTSMLMGYKNNPQIFTDYISKLKLDKPLGLELPGEGLPFFKTPKDKKWSSISLPWMSIGYELRMTPLQLLSIYNAVANDGKMIKPIMVKAIGQKGEIENKIKSEVLNEQIAKTSTIKKINILLRGAVVNGTAKNISKCKINISGKTGTARIADSKGYTEGNYFSSFAGFFPSENPIYSIIIVINKPTIGGYFGGIVAAPVAEEIAEKMAGVNPITASLLADSVSNPYTLPSKIIGEKESTIDFLEKLSKYKIKSDDLNNWVVADIQKTDTYLLSNIQDENNFFPNLIGMGLKDAIMIAESRYIKIISTGKGRVYWQSEPAGHKIIKEKTLLIKLKL